MHSPAPGGSFLLVGTDQSSTCLTCHQHAGDTGPSSYHISTAETDMPAGSAPLQRTPGGDFGWLKKTYNFTVRGTAITEDGATHGHNIIAGDFGYVIDPENNTTSPGGTFPSSQLACSSCHDPHGRYRRDETNTISAPAPGQAGFPIVGSGSYSSATEPPAPGQAYGAYRLLAGVGYSTTAPFPGVPGAKVPSSYNRTEASTQTRAAYGYSMTTAGRTSWGQWCATCHGDMHSGGNYVHPVDQGLGSEITGLYNAYKMTGDMSGTSADSFTSLVPFVESTTDYGVLGTHAQNDDSYLNGPSTADQVSCLSCHRAHASGWEYALRWNMENEFMIYNGLYPGTDTTPTRPQSARGRTSAETQAAYYDRPVTTFASYQRVLCNKCHAQD